MRTTQMLQTHADFLACNFFPACLNRSLLPGEELDHAGPTAALLPQPGPFPSSPPAQEQPPLQQLFPSALQRNRPLLDGTLLLGGGICILLATGNGKTSRPCNGSPRRTRGCDGGWESQLTAAPDAFWSFRAFYRQEGNKGKKRLGFTGRRCLSLLTNSFLVIIYWKK